MVWCFSCAFISRIFPSSVILPFSGLLLCKPCGPTVTYTETERSGGFNPYVGGFVALLFFLFVIKTSFSSFSSREPLPTPTLMSPRDWERTRSVLAVIRRCS